MSIMSENTTSEEVVTTLQKLKKMQLRIKLNRDHTNMKQDL